MKYIWLIFTSVFLLLSGCGGQPPLEKAILGTWVQETPTSTTTSGIQTLTSDTVLRLKKNGETHLTRNLDVTGQASVKTVIAADKSQLILQDVELGITDVYRRK